MAKTIASLFIALAVLIITAYVTIHLMDKELKSEPTQFHSPQGL